MAKRRYNSWSYYGNYSPKKPIKVENGIALKSKKGEIVEKWWAKRWISVLESFNIGERLNRGKRYARKGQVISIEIQEGSIKAKVQGTKPKPYSVEINLKPFSNKEWNLILDQLTSKALFVAKLLNGEMPQQIEEVFSDVNINLFPKKHDDLITDCSCPDYSNPCKHIAAVYYILGEKFDENPFLIFKLRGLSKESLLNQIRKRRTTTFEQDIKAKEMNDTGIIGKESENIGDQKVNISDGSSKSAENFSHDEILNFWGENLEDNKISICTEDPEIDGMLMKRLGKSPFMYKNKELSSILSNWYRIIKEKGKEEFL